MQMKSFILISILCLYTATAQNYSNLSQVSNDFCFALLKEFPESQNVFFSPASIYIALGMLFAGANSSTANVMQRVLKYDNVATNETTVHESFSNVISLLNAASGEYKLSIANALLYQSGFSALPEFNDTLVSHYNAFLKEVDFAGNDQEAIEEINDWVKNQTRNKIRKFLEELPPNAVMLLLNAIYFKGTWKKEFDADYTKNGTFYNGGTNAVTVPMMFTEDVFRTGNFYKQGFNAIELPYKGGHLGMLIILPDKDDKLAEVEANLVADDISNVISEMYSIKMSVTIPKFKLEDSRQLKRNLSSLGLDELFTEDADFSKINGVQNIVVSEVLHKAAIKVNEEGSEAAAVTGAVVTSYSAKPSFYADHPFLFFIRDVRTNLILFAGRVNQLKEEFAVRK